MEEKIRCMWRCSDPKHYGVMMTDLDNVDEIATYEGAKCHICQQDMRIINSYLVIVVDKIYRQLPPPTIGGEYR